MTLSIYDSKGYVGDLSSNNGYSELVKKIPTELEIISELLRDGIIAVDDNFLNEVKSLKGDEDVKNFKTLCQKCEDCVIITDGVFNGDNEIEPDEEIEDETPKAYSKEQKTEIWNKFEQKTLKQEEEFKQVFSKVFQEQKELIVKEFETTQRLPDLIDEKTAKEFKPIIEKTYISGYEDAV